VKGGCPIRWRSVSLTACSVLVLAGCGGGSASVDQQNDASPRIEKGVATELAARSDEVARLLASGDDCGATAESGRLRDELTRAINRGVIPEVYLEDLSGAVNEIQARIPPCGAPTTQPPPPPANEDNDQGKKDEDHGNGKGKGKAKGKKTHDDEGGE
jgi:hypothetical protein